MTQVTTLLHSDRLYTRRFFQIFAAVMLFMTGMALQFHFAQYVAYIGYGVDVLGFILAFSMAGTLLIRLHLGRWIDRFGGRPMWLVGTVVAAVAVGLMQFVHTPWALAGLRALSQMASAGVMTTVAVLAARIAPPRRRAESIGTIGLGGFLGMILGPTLGDWIFCGETDTMLPYRVFFSSSAAFSLLSGGVILMISLPPALKSATTSDALPTPTASSQARMIVEHWPGVVLLVGTVFAMVFCFHSSFLERLAEERGFRNIKMFFLIYGPTAILLRLVFRRVPQQIGRTRALLGGMLLFGAGLVCMIGIQSQWQLIVPGIVLGAGHCFIFPSMVDLAAERLPHEHRGTGTALILGAGDLGMLIGFGALGALITAFGFDAALGTLAGCVFLTAGLLAIYRREAVFARRNHLHPRPSPTPLPREPSRD